MNNIIIIIMYSTIIIKLFFHLYRFGMANESTPISLTDVNCARSTHLHLLRCDHIETVNNSGIEYGCDHTKDVVVYCGELA